LTPSPLALLGAKTYDVSIFGTTAPGMDMGEDVARWFSEHLKQPVRLLYIAGRREIPGSVFIPNHQAALQVNDRIRFADAAPLLITTTASEKDAMRRLPKGVHEDVITRFRPNVHIENDGPAYEEDAWEELRIGKVTIKCVFKTPRCLSLNVDIHTGGVVETRKQMYGLLAKDRRVNIAFPSEYPSHMVAAYLNMTFPAPHFSFTFGSPVLQCCFTLVSPVL